MRSGCRRLAAAERLAQFAHLRVDDALAGGGFRGRAFPRALRAEQTVGDGGAGAGQRQIGHRDVRITHRERQRGAGLVAVERAVAGRIEPDRAMALPVLQRVRCPAGAAALVAGAAWTVILLTRGAEIGAEAEAHIRERDRTIRIAFAGCDAVAKSGDQDVAHLMSVVKPLRQHRPARDIYGDVGGAAVARPKVDRLGAIQRRLLRGDRRRQTTRRRWRRPEPGR